MCVFEWYRRRDLVFFQPEARIAMIELYLVVGAVVATSATCSLFEAVLYSVPASRVEMLVRAERPSGRLLRALRKRVDEPIAAILSLNTIANTGGGALAGAIAAEVLGVGNVLYFSIGFTLVILMVSEVLPKTLGVVHAARLAPVVAFPLRWLVIVFLPLVMLTRTVTGLFRATHEERLVSDEELLTMVGLGLRSGTLTPHEARVIENVLAMDTRTAREIMTPRPVVFTIGADVVARDAASLDDMAKHSRIPVFGQDPEDLVGVVHRVDVLTAVAKDRFETPLETMMRPIHFVVDTTPLDTLLRTFLERRQHLVAVIDEFGGFAGIVTLEDVLEELIGREIVDESDQITDLRAYAHRRREETLRGRGIARTP